MSYAFNDAIKEYCEKQSKVDKEFAEDYKKKNKSIQGCVDYILSEMAKDSYVQKHKNKGVCGMGVTDDVVYGLVHHYFHEDLDVKVLDPKEVKVSVSVTPQTTDKPISKSEEVEDEVDEEIEDEEETEESVKKYTGDILQRFEALIKDGKTPMQKPSKAAWNMYSLVDKNKVGYSGLLYKDGWRCGTNGHVIVAERTDYPKAYEDRVITKKGEDVAQAKDIDSILNSIKKQAHKIARIDVLSVRSSLAGIKKDTADLDYTYVILGLPGACVLLRYQEAVKFFNALEHYKMNTILYGDQTTPILAYDDDVFMIIMPCTTDWDHDYLDTMEGYYPIDLRGSESEMVEKVEIESSDDADEEGIEEADTETDTEGEVEDDTEEVTEESGDDDDMYIPLF